MTGSEQKPSASAGGDPYEPPPETGAHHPRSWAEKVFPTVMAIDLVGLVVFATAVVGTVMWEYPPDRLADVELAPWFIAFIALLILRALLFLLADALLIYRHPLCHALYLPGYALSLLGLAVQPRMVGFMPWLYAAQVAAFLGWNGFFLYVARAHLKRGRKRGGTR